MARSVLPVLLLVSAPVAAAQSGPVRPGQGFEVERYGVELRPDLATTILSGTETIVLRATADGVRELAFTPNALRISEASANAASIHVAAQPDALVFSLPKALRKGERTTLRFRMAGKPARGVTAVPAGIYASYFACDWMVCLQDTPGDKARLTLDLFLPAGAESVGVGRADPRATLPGGMVRHRWRSTRAYSPYLYAFAAGAFPRATQRTAIGQFVYFDATGALADLPARFARSPEMAAFFADKAGVPLPDARYIQLLVPAREAQETASFSLIGAGELALERDDPSAAWVIAHEMAHQWWGNLVTCATWQDFWLNEGITTFMVAAWKQHAFGEFAYRQELDVARRKLERARAIGFDKPLAWAGRYPSLSARRAVQYSKGALFLADLREAMGDTPFWNGLRRFTRSHAGGTVTSRDFQQAMQQASARDLSPAFAAWVYDEAPRPPTNPR